MNSVFIYLISPSWQNRGALKKSSCQYNGWCVVVFIVHRIRATSKYFHPYIALVFMCVCVVVVEGYFTCDVDWSSYSCWIILVIQLIKFVYEAYRCTIYWLYICYCLTRIGYIIIITLVLQLQLLLFYQLFVISAHFKYWCFFAIICGCMCMCLYIDLILVVL